MAIEARFLQEAWVEDYTPTVARTGGEVVRIEGNQRVGVCQDDIAANATGTVHVRGMVEIKKKASLAISIGTLVYWDDTNNEGVVTAGTFAVGICAKAAAAADSVVLVHLNVVAGLPGPVLVSQAYTNAEAVAGTVKKIYDANLPFKAMVADVWLRADNGTAGTAKVTDGTTDITDAMTHGTTDKAIVRAATIDDAAATLAVGSTLQVTPATGGAGTVFVLLIPVA